MYENVYVYTYIYIYMYIYVCTHIYIYIHIYAHAHTNIIMSTGQRVHRLQQNINKKNTNKWLTTWAVCTQTPIEYQRQNNHQWWIIWKAEYTIQGGKYAQDALSCRSLSAKEPLIIRLCCGKWPIKIRHPMGLRHPVEEWMLEKTNYGVARLVGSLKSHTYFAEYSLFYRALLQKRPKISRSLLIVATP